MAESLYAPERSPPRDPAAIPGPLGVLSGAFLNLRRALERFFSKLGCRDRSSRELAAARIPPRPAPRLKVDPEGNALCVACFLCEAICPTRSIKIAAEFELGSGRDRRLREFEVDFLLCVFCGLCEEVCPVGAIELSGPPPPLARTPEEFRLSALREARDRGPEKLTPPPGGSPGHSASSLP